MPRIEIIDEINDETQNIYLRKISVSDTKFFYESLIEDPVSKYLSLGPLQSLDHSKKLIKTYLKYWDQNSQFNYIIELRKNDIKKIGSISLWNISWLHRRAEIGIWINSKYWNQGLGEKAINLIKIIAERHLLLHRIEAHIAAQNTRSINLFKKCNFKEEGILQEYLNLKGKFENAVILAFIF